MINPQFCPNLYLVRKIQELARSSPMVSAFYTIFFICQKIEYIVDNENVFLPDNILP